MNAIYSDYSPIFLYVDKYRFSKNWGYPGSTVPYSLIRYVISGTAVFSLGDTSYDVGPDDVFYIPQGSVLSCAAKEEIAFISIRFVSTWFVSAWFISTWLIRTWFIRCRIF